MVAAYVLALPIGWEREHWDRSAGIRTFPLVAIASCGFLLAAGELDSSSKSRVIQGVVTGMGFVGGGAILKHEGSVHGTATAASLWATGAIGVACALHAYLLAVIISALTFVTLRFLAPLHMEEVEDKNRKSPPDRPA
jgi:putative Mg2+ transporter-C (MgtC) family protein